MSSIFKALSLTLLITLATTSLASVRPSTDEPYSKLELNFELQMNNSAIFGEKIDYHHGNVGFEQVDLEAKGNGIPIIVSRTFYSGALYPFQAHLEFGDWALNIPSVQTSVITNSSGESSGDWLKGQECTGLPYSTTNIYENNEAYRTEEYFDGVTLLLGDGQKQALLKNSGVLERNTTTYAWVTKGNWKFSCITRDNGAGEGFVGYSPNGLKITFNKSTLTNPRTITKSNGVVSKFTVSLLASKIEDRFGNYIQYNYDSSNYLTSITANDGRTVFFTYLNGKVNTMSYNGRVWNYSYTGESLTKVKDPANQEWGYDLETYGKYTTYPTIASSGCGFKTKGINSEYQTNSDITASVTAPNGLKANYVFSPRIHGRANVTPIETGMDDGSMLTKSCSANHSLIQKSITGPGLTSLKWDYAYSGNSGYYTGNTIISSMKLTGTLPSNIDNINYNTATETTPEGNVIVRYYDRRYDSVSEGQVAAQETFDDSGNKLEQIQYSFDSGYDFGLSFAGVFNELGVTKEVQLNNTQTKTIRYYSGGTDTYIASNSSFNLYGLSGLTTESNDFSSNKRYTTQTYVNDTINWVLGLPALTQISSDGSSYKPTKQTSYYSATSSYKSLPYQEFAYGRWYKRYDSYHSIGLPNKVSYNGTNRWYIFSNYKRGTPQTIQTPQSLSITAQYAYNVVDNNGWVTTQTDFNGNCVNASYDNIGRMTLFDPCDSSLANTTIAYASTAGSDGYAGVEAGMLRQIVTTGSYQKRNYFDGFVRQVFATERDTSKSDTLRVFAKEYDSMNNLTFESHISDSGDISKGISYSYNALGQKLTVTDNTINATASFNYVDGNKLYYTDYESNLTKTSYLAYGSPEYENEILIESPQSVDTTVNYNIFGNVNSIVQEGLTETHVYDAYQQLCKIVRPEYGAIAYSYDAIGQLNYLGKGSSVSTATTSCDTAITSTDKINYVYDNLGNIRTVNYGDSTPGLTYTYDKNSNVKSVTASSFTQSFNYNSLNKPTSEVTTVSGKTMSVGYTYDSYGNVNSISYPNGYKVTLSPDAMGYSRALQRVSNSYASALNYATSIAYHANGTPSQYTFGNGLVTTVDLNDRNMPTELKTSNSSLTALDHSYTYDGNGNVTSYLDNRNSRYSLNLLSYDGLDRLTAISGGSFIGNTSLSYDTRGNIKTYNTHNSNLTYNYDTTTNRLYSVSGSGATSKAYSSFGYDTRGNVTNNSYRSFTYNLASQMVQSGTYTYVYDAENRRIKQSDSKGTSYSFYSKDGKLLYRETPSGGINYVYLNNKLIAKDGAGNKATALIEPTATISCDPSSCFVTKTGTGTTSIAVSLATGCTNGCDVEWFYTGPTIFNNSTGENPKSFNYYCRGINENKSGTVGAIVTDISTGLKKTVSRYLTFTCTYSGG